VAANAHFAKGMILISGSVLAVGEGIVGIAAAGATIAAAFPPMGVVLAATALLCIVCDIVVVKTTGSTSTMKPFEKKLQKALISEFGRDYYPDKTDESYAISHTHERLEIFEQEIVRALKQLEGSEDLEGAAQLKLKSDDEHAKAREEQKKAKTEKAHAPATAR